jgi:hypothetical protein
MNVVTPRLLLADYPRANYIKRELEHIRRYLVTAHRTGETDKGELLMDYLETHVGLLRSQTGNAVDDAGGEGDVGGEEES